MYIFRVGTMTLSCAFFLCFLMLAISKTYTQFVGGNNSTTKFEKVVTMAANTMGLAPMLCVTSLIVHVFIDSTDTCVGFRASTVTRNVRRDIFIKRFLPLGVMKMQRRIIFDS